MTSTTTTTTPVREPGRGPAGRLRWAVHDAAVLTRRDLRHLANRPGQLATELLFPVMVVLMFGYLFGGAMAVPGGGDYRAYLMPGMFVLAMLFGLERTVVAVTTDATKGITDRFRSLPMAGSAVVAGRAAADLLNSVIGLVVMAGTGLAVGWRWAGGPGGAGAALLAFGLILALRFALLWVGIYLGLLMRTPESVVAVQILVWPLGFLSNAFVPPGTMPGWLGAIADANPLSATVAAARELYGNPAGGESWLVQHALPLAVGWPLLLTAVFAPLAVHRYRRLDR